MSEWAIKSGFVFHKMHGLGNDFVVIDVRGGGPQMTSALARALGDRHRGVGFDQLAVVHDSSDADLALEFFNADGTTAGACGNATRCVAQAEMAAQGRDRLTLRTERGILEARAESGRVAVNMGSPVTDWESIPLSRDVDTLHLPIEGDPVATSMGNPHCTFFVDDAEDVDLLEFGPRHEGHPLFPERTNVQVVQKTGDDRLRMRVWERGTGLTLASGSSSCAAVVAANRRGLTGRTVTVDLDGGAIDIDWRDDGVWMTGPTAHVFTGHLSQSFLDGLQ